MRRLSAIFKLDAKTAAVNGTVKSIDLPTKIVSNRILILLRLVGEAFSQLSSLTFTNVSVYLAFLCLAMFQLPLFCHLILVGGVKVRLRE